MNFGHFTRRARRDLEQAADWYAVEAGPRIARRFVLAVDRAAFQIADMNGIGSRRWSDPSLADLRVWPVKGFPYLLFYRAPEGRVEILRALHAARDIPETLRD